MFQRFWAFEIFKQKTREQLGSDYFEKFLNCLINDLTYCLEEGLAKLANIKEYEDKFKANPQQITAEDKKNMKQIKSTCKANF